MQKHLLIVMATILCTIFAAHTQDVDFETFRRQQEQQFRDFVQERDSMIQLLDKQFAQYVEERNREYAEYLRSDWERRQVFLGLKPDTMPKPDEIPPYEPPQEEERESRIIERIPPAEARITPRDAFIEPVRVRQPEPQAPAPPSQRIIFYGRAFSIETNTSFEGLQTGGIRESDVAQWFEKAAARDFTPSLLNLLEIADETGMNDWALFRLTQTFAQKIAPDPQSQTLYTWFLLLQAGYDIRIGRQEENLVLLMPFAQTIYNTPRLNVDQGTYYLIGGESGVPVFTYGQSMPGAFRQFDMNFYKSPRFAQKGKTKQISFSYNHNYYELQLQYDPVLVDMLAHQPQADMNVYLDADASSFLVKSAGNSLNAVLENKSDVEKVSFLLRLTQTAFEYQTDIEQFGHQKYMTPDEVIHYRYSDCDDRAVLFGWLVRNFAGQQVAALLYPGHLANAVHFHQGNPPGDQLLIDGKPFVVADPTFINAPIGLTMPEFANTPPTAWIIDAGKYLHEQTQLAWQTLFEMGGRRGNNHHDLVITPQGQIFATGYFTGNFGIPPFNLTGKEDKRTAFVASLDENMQLLWAHALDSKNDATGFSMIQDEAQRIIVAGSFSEQLEFSGQRLKTSQAEPDAFIAAFSPQGRMLWLQRAGLNSQHQNQALAYSFHIDPNGKPLTVNYYNDPRESRNGLYADGENGFVLTGTFGNTSGLTTFEAPELASRARVDFADMLIQKNQEMIQNDVEASIAGLFAAIHLVKSEGVVFPGSAAQEALQRSNPRFSATFPETFANIGKINFLRNKSGIIEIRTENGDDVFFDKLRIRDRSTVRVRTLPNQDEQIDILSRIQVGQLIVWYQLNFIRLYRQTGDLLFDYRRNNTQVKMNLKKEILQ